MCFAAFKLLCSCLATHRALRGTRCSDPAAALPSAAIPVPSAHKPLPTPPPAKLLQFECPESFQEATCALTASDDPASFAAECDARAPRCTGFALLARSSIANINTKRIGILKDSTGTIAPHHIAYSPFSAVFLRSDAAALPPLPADPATANVPNAFGSHRNASWLVLMRPDAVLRTTQDGGKWRCSGCAHSSSW